MSVSTATASPVNPTVPSTPSADKNLEKWQKGIKAALALKITAIVFAVLLTAIAAAAAILVFPASAVIGTAIGAGVLLIGAMAALIAQEVLLKKKRAADEKALEEKNDQQEQVILDLRDQLTSLEKIKREIKNSTKLIPGMMELCGKLGKFSESLKDKESEAALAETKVNSDKDNISLSKDDEAMIPTEFIENTLEK